MKECYHCDGKGSKFNVIGAIRDVPPMEQVTTECSACKGTGKLPNDYWGFIDAVDFLGKELNVGDEVVCIELGYRNLVKCKIVSLSPKMAVVKKDRGYEFKQFHDQIINISGESSEKA